MKVRNATFPFTLDHRQYVAHVSMFTPANTPMVRVWVETPSKLKVEPPSRKKVRIPEPEVFVFYKQKPGELFWFDLHGRKQAMAEKIAKLLLA